MINEVTMTPRKGTNGPLDRAEDQRAIVQDVVSMQVGITRLEQLNTKIYKEVKWLRKQLFEQTNHHNRLNHRQQSIPYKGYA